MLYKSTLAAAAACFTLATAAPAPASPKQQSGEVGAFSIGQVPVPQSAVKKNGPRQYAKALRKYKAAIPERVHAAAVAAADGSSSGSVAAEPSANDEAYLSPVQVGSPPQTLMLDFDTGSADLWVFSDKLPSSEQTGHAVYQTDASKLQSGSSWKISYGDGSGASGTVYADTVNVGGVTATSQAVEAATSVSSVFSQNVDTDGLVGLAFSAINTVQPKPATTFFDTVKSSLAQPLFAAYLQRNAPGTYDFGATNQSHYKGQIGYTDVNTANGLWQFSAGTVSVGGTALGTLGDAIADTGTSIILAPTELCMDYYQQVEGASISEELGGFVFPCSATLPDLTINIAGGDRTVPGDFINYAQQAGQCFGGLQPNQGLPFTILGDTFLKSQYVVFNGADSPQIGFAAQA
ncbi:MAG: hypothetical protein Q9162_004085 [Coniocarpon cinnabarinum]